MDKEISDKLLDLYLHNLEDAVSTIDKVVPVIAAFDGKVITCRLEKEIQKVTGKQIIVFADVHKMHIKQCFYADSQRRAIVNGSACYLPDGYDEVVLCQIYNSCLDSHFIVSKDADRYFYIDEKYKTRLTAAPVVKSMTEFQERLAGTIQKLKDAASRVPEYLQRLKDIQVQAESLAAVIPYEIKDIYDICCHMEID